VLIIIEIIIDNNKIIYIPLIYYILLKIVEIYVILEVFFFFNILLIIKIYNFINLYKLKNGLVNVIQIHSQNHPEKFLLFILFFYLWLIH